MTKAKKISKVSKIKKRWIPVQASRIFNNQTICDTLIGDPSKAIGKTIPINLMNLTRDMKKQNITITFVIDNITGEKATAQFVAYKMSPASIKKITRRGKDKIDITCKAETSEQSKLILKLLLITRSKTYASVLTSLRKAAVEEFQRVLKGMKQDDMIKAMITNRLQIEIKKKLSKVYPLKTIEIKNLKITKLGKAPVEVKQPVKPYEVKTEEKEDKPKETKTEKPIKKAEPKVEEKKEVKPAEK